MTLAASLLRDREVPSLGLTSAEVAERRARGLTNDVGERTSRSIAEILRANLLTRFNFIMGSLLAVILLVGKAQDAVFGIVLVVNALIGIAQELRAKRTLDRLAVVSVPGVRVIRDGMSRVIGARDLVVADLIELASGDQLVIDGVVCSSEGLQAGAATFTGRGTWVLGAPELVLPAGYREVLSQAADLAASGRRVLVVGHAPTAKHSWSDESLPRGVRPVALVILAERLRADTRDAIAYFKAQGVALKVISGDSPRADRVITHTALGVWRPVTEAGLTRIQNGWATELGHERRPR